MSVLLPDIKELIKQGNLETIKETIEDLLPRDIGEIIIGLPHKIRNTIINLLNITQICSAIEDFEEEEAIKLLKLLPKEKLGAVLDNLSPDYRADLISKLDEKTRKEYLSLMSPEEVKNVKELISHLPTIAAGIMTTDYVAIPSELTCNEAIEFLRKKSYDFEFNEIYVVEGKKLIGSVNLRELILADKNLPVKEIAKIVPTVDLSVDQEKVAEVMKKYDITAIPVVTKDKELKGRITFDDIMDVITDEATEDMHKFGGSIPMYKNYMRASIGYLFTSRFPWLIILLVANFATSFIIQKFTYVLQQVIQLVIFMPILLDSSGNAGSQSASVVIRGLATGEIKFTDVGKIFIKELLVGILLGAALSAFIFLRSMAVLNQIKFCLTICLSIASAIMLATILGAFLPIIFTKLKIDPANVSSPLITTIMDIGATAIYFAIAIKLIIK